MYARCFRYDHEKAYSTKDLDKATDVSSLKQSYGKDKRFLLNNTC